MAKHADKPVLSAGTSHCPPRPTRPNSTACRIRIPAQITSRVSRRPNSPRSARSPASRILPISSSIMCRATGSSIEIAETLPRLLSQSRRFSRRLYREDWQGLVRVSSTEMAADRRLLVSPRRHSDRCLLADRRIAVRHLAPRPGRRPLSRPRLRPEMGPSPGRRAHRSRPQVVDKRLAVVDPREGRKGDRIADHRPAASSRSGSSPRGTAAPSAASG